MSIPKHQSMQRKQAGAELGQAHPKSGPQLDLSNINFVDKIDEQEY